MELNQLYFELISAGRSALSDEALKEDARAHLLKLIRENAIFYGDFTLSSGKKSSYYLDLRRITLDSRALPLIGYLLLSEISEAGYEIDAISGPTLGADPLISAVLTMAPYFLTDLKGLIVRKEQKSHGMAKLIEGPSDGVKKVVAVEDVVTTGGSLLRAVKMLKESGFEVEMAICIVDRKEANMGAVFSELGCDFRAIFSIDQVINK